MAKTAKMGRDGPHSRSHISMVMARNNLTKVAIDAWDLGPDTCPMSTLEVASIHFLPLAEKGYTKNRKWQHTPPWATNGSPIP